MTVADLTESFHTVLNTPQQKNSLPPLTPPPPSRSSPPPIPLRTIPDSMRSNFKHLTNSTWWTQLNRPKYIRVVAQFRLGSHQLHIETQRWGRERLPRSLHICKCCNLGIREDELCVTHLVYIALTTLIFGVTITFTYPVILTMLTQQ